MPTPLDPAMIPKYVNELVIPPVYIPTVVRHPATGHIISHNYEVTASQFTQQILPPGFRATTVVIARELGIPAVLGCGNAMLKLKTGDRVLVDGGKGTVSILGKD